MLCYWLYHTQHIKDIDSMLLLYCRYVRKIILSNLLLFTLSDACFSLPYKEGLIIKCYCQVGNQEIRYALQNFVEKTVYFHVDSLSLDQTRPLAFRWYVADKMWFILQLKIVLCGIIAEYRFGFYSYVWCLPSTATWNFTKKLLMFGCAKSEYLRTKLLQQFCLAIWHSVIWVCIAC